jgi:hypothetical protein
LKEAEVRGVLSGHKICPRVPSLSHLFFADDSVMLMKARREEAVVLKEILQLYENCSGQCINVEKSSLLFSANARQRDKQMVKVELGIVSESWNEKYLGMPLYIGKSKRKAFAYIKDKIWKAIQGWLLKLLSRAGKEVMIKAVAQAIPTFLMSCFYLTKSFCDELSAMIAKYWWSQQDKENKMHWISWRKLIKSKGQGGLGFRDIHAFNIAMLSRQAWRLIQNPDSLCATILKAKYYPDCHILEAKPCVNMSYTWRSILHGIELVKEGVIWCIGDGEC